MALALGRTVQELLETLDYDELLEWHEYYCLEPFGEIRADLRMANLCALTANINRDSKKRPQPYGLEQFMLFKEEQPKKEEKEFVSAETVAFFYAVAKPSEELH